MEQVFPPNINWETNIFGLKFCVQYMLNGLPLRKLPWKVSKSLVDVICVGSSTFSNAQEFLQFEFNYLEAEDGQIVL